MQSFHTFALTRHWLWMVSIVLVIKTAFIWLGLLFFGNAQSAMCSWARLVYSKNTVWWLLVSKPGDQTSTNNIRGESRTFLLFNRRVLLFRPYPWIKASWASRRHQHPTGDRSPRTRRLPSPDGRHPGRFGSLPDPRQILRSNCDFRSRSVRSYITD
jgi:hypothetical protein